jgi:hypothetical protein
MLSCRKSAQLMSQGMDRSLGLREHIALRLHLLACHGCRNARRQLEFIRHACEAWVRHDD